MVNPEVSAPLRAPQPDIIRSVEKDALYIEQLVNNTQETTLNLLGPRATVWFKESRLAATMLYHLLTTGRGFPTLGEEYCNLLQVDGSNQYPALPRRLLLSLSRSLGAYAADRIQSQVENRIAASGTLAGDDNTAVYLDDDDDDNDEDGDGVRVFGGANRHVVAAAGGEIGPAADALTSRHHPGRGSSLPFASLVHRVRSLKERSKVEWGKLLDVLALYWPRLKPVLLLSLRLHLALFYLRGSFFDLAHRVTGIRYTLLDSPKSRRNPYRVLGLLLTTQIGLAAGIQGFQWIRTNASFAATSSNRFVAAAGRFLTPSALRRGSGRVGGRVGGGVEAAGGERGEIEGEGEASEGSREEGVEAEPSSLLHPGHAVLVDEVAEAIAEAQRVAAAAAETQRRRQQTAKKGEVVGGEAVDSSGKNDDDGGSGGGGDGGDGGDDNGGGSNNNGSGSSNNNNSGNNNNGGGDDDNAVDGSAIPHLPLQPACISVECCLLCTEPKRHPTATPCGHVFCWDCVTSWIVQKECCPVCREDVRPKDLTCLYHCAV